MDNSILQLYQDLRQLQFDRDIKQSEWENQTDVLEILAVAGGIKPAHLNGHGMRDEHLLDALEKLSASHGLHALRLSPHPPTRLSKPNLEPEFLDWCDARDRTLASESPKVLWIYKEPSTRRLIEELSAGSSDESVALGYPRCCVEAHCALGAEMQLLLVEGYKSQYGAKSVRDLIALSEQDAKVALSRPIRTLDDESKCKFPFLQCTACASCLSSDESPAGILNRQMKELADSVDGEFAARIQAVAMREVEETNRLKRMRADIPPIDDLLESAPGTRTRRVGRNDPCPCGSGKKFKKCCGHSN